MQDISKSACQLHPGSPMYSPLTPYHRLSLRGPTIERYKVPPKEKPRKNLILDLDDTLVYSSSRDLDPDVSARCQVIRFQDSGTKFMMFVYIRPFLTEFLREMSKDYDISIYTAACESYAKAVLEETKINRYITKLYHRSSCELAAENIHIKDIFKLGFARETSVFVDDLFLQIKHAKENSVLIKGFKGDKNDKILLNLIPFFKHIADLDDVRPVNSRLARYFRPPLVQEPEMEQMESSGSSCSSPTAIPGTEKVSVDCAVAVPRFPSDVCKLKHRTELYGARSFNNYMRRSFGMRLSVITEELN